MQWETPSKMTSAGALKFYEVFLVHLFSLKSKEHQIYLHLADASKQLF